MEFVCDRLSLIPSQRMSLDRKQLNWLAKARGMASMDPALSPQIQKRLTLNLLIQGAAAHTFVSASHLVERELEELDEGLTLLYDRFSISGQLNYCLGDNALFFGRPNRWWGLSRTPQKPFRDHPFLASYANQLASEEVRHLRQLAKKKSVRTVPIVHWCQFMKLILQVTSKEKGIQSSLEMLAKRVASEIWSIDESRLTGVITQSVEFGNLRQPKTYVGRMCRVGAVGYGGVQRVGDRFQVVARAWVFPLLVHELVKGIAELVCLHGLNELDEESYEAVTAEADQLEYEAWLLQAGPAMWRRVIRILPRDRQLAHSLMHIARLEPDDLNRLMTMVIEQPERAQQKLASLGNSAT